MVAAHVIPRKVLPLYAAIPISFPYLLTEFTTLTMIVVDSAEAMPRAKKPSWNIIRKDAWSSTHATY